MLAVRDLWAGYDGAQVLRGITFEMAAGQCLAILGHNGAGKTTLIKALMGLLRLERGQIILHGRALHHASVQQRVRRGLGWVPQERGLFPSLTVQEHLAVVARPGPWNPEKIYALFPRLAERRRHGAQALSGGEQQMLAIGRALMTNPRLLLLDEPFEGLSPLMAQELVQALQRLQEHFQKDPKGAGLIVVEQHIARALRMADQVLVLARGEQCFLGSGQALDAAPEFERWLGLRPDIP
ncbi:MAG TPA: ABC transporter ATP-binding protein [Paenalcaligenes sp.]|nr:ABC transporter ATP-binding protein [Paenalcaligenes sp.]